MPPSPPRKDRSTMIIVIAAFASIVLLFIFFCSGLNFPVISPQSSLVNRIHADFKIASPASLKVIHAARCAMRDPAYYYECNIATADLSLLMDQISAAAKAAAYPTDDHAEDRRFSIGPPPPAWYNPASLADRQSLAIDLPVSASQPSDTGYWFFFSPSTGKIYIFWYST